MADTTPLATAQDDSGANGTAQHRGSAGRRRWPLLLIGASAGTATWSGWVGLGELTGFGVVHPLPGIWDSLTVNTAITLPVGVEAYAVYALAVATDSRPLTRLARRWAWASAVGALLLGMGGQIAYHLLAARGVTTAPAWVVALVSSLPVLVLGAASLLWHLAAATPTAVVDEAAHAAAVRVTSPGPAGQASAVAVSVEVVPDTAPGAGPDEVPASTAPGSEGPDPRLYSLPRPADSTGGKAVSGAVASRGPSRPGSAWPTVTATVVNPSDDDMLAQLDALPVGEDLPSIRALMRDHGIGQARATRVHREATTRRARRTSAVAGHGGRGAAAAPSPTPSDHSGDPEPSSASTQGQGDDHDRQDREQNHQQDQSQTTDTDQDHEPERHEDSQNTTGDETEDSPTKIHN